MHKVIVFKTKAVLKLVNHLFILNNEISVLAKTRRK